jgi:hypothetical protein
LDADLGGCYKYVQRYAQDVNKTVTEACLDALDRTLKAVQYILDEAEKMNAGKAAESKAA